MNKSPCFPFYPSDFFGDIKVRIMTGEEQAFYLLLLANIWEFDTQFSIPDDQKIICTLLKISDEKFLEISTKILDCFQRKNGKLISKRLKQEKDKQVNYRKQQSEKGKKSAEKRATTVEQWLNNGATEGATEGQPEVNSSKPKPKPISKPKIQKKDAAHLVLPNWIPQEPWDGFVAMRKEIKKPLTGRAITLAVNTLLDLKNKGHDPGSVLDQSTMAKWQGLFELKTGGSNANNRPNFNERPGAWRRPGQPTELPAGVSATLDEINRRARDAASKAAGGT